MSVAIVAPVIEALAAYRLVFTHAGRLFDQSALRALFIDKLESRGLAIQLQDALAPERPAEDKQVAIFENFASIPTASNKCQFLGNLRIGATRALEAGQTVLLLSEKPALALSECPGSSIIRDAKHVFIDPLPFPSEGNSDVAEQRMHEWSNGLPLLYKGLQRIADGETDDQAAIESARTYLEGELFQALIETGPDLASWLDCKLFQENRETVPIAPEDMDLINASRGAGFGHISEDTVSLFPGRLNAMGRAALRTYCDTTLAVPASLAFIAEGLWRLERTLRKHLRTAAHEHHGRDWRRLALEEELAKRAIERAKKDCYPALDDISSVPNPLDWLTLEELGTMLEAQWAGATINRVIWRRLISEVGPIRNRLAHMRLPLPEDAATIRRWLGRID